MSVAASSSEEPEADALRRAQRAHEPSMEEILASIRAIIADDREPSPPKPQIVYSNDAPRGEEEPPRQLLPPAPKEPGPPSPTVVWSRERPVDIAPPLDEAPLLSDEAESAVAASFQTLSENMAAHGLEIAGEMAREMLRPMIKSWLDENLPAMVERLVRAEIQRVARGSR